MPEELRNSTVAEEPKAETAVLVSTPASSADTGVIVADQPKEESGFRRYNSDKGEFETLSTDLEDKPAEPAKTEEAPKAAEEKPAEPVLLAGKYKTPEDLEKAYKELERKFHEDRQKAKTETTEQKVEVSAKETAKEVLNETPKYADLLLEDPRKFEDTMFERIDQRMKTHAQVQELQAEWEKTNPDLKDMRDYVSIEVKQILASHPEKAGADLRALLSEATGNLRAKLQPMMAQAEQKAMTVRTTVQPLGVTGATRKEEHTPAEKGAPNVDPLEAELKARKAHLSRVTGRVPVR